MRRVLCAIALAIPVAVLSQAPGEAFDIGKRNTNGNIDIPRMREGSLDALRATSGR